MLKSAEFWHWFFSIVGPSTFLGAILFFILSVWRDHRRWVADNKKGEWRQMLDELQACMEQMAFVFKQTVSFQESSYPEIGMSKGYRILHDRIFIADAVRKYSLEDKWTDLCAYVQRKDVPREPNEQGNLPTATGFNIKTQTLKGELVDCARRDLNLDSSLFRWWNRLRTWK